MKLTSKETKMRKLALLAAICNAFLVGNLKAGENRLYNYHTNPYSVHRPYRPSYYGMNNYYTKGYGYCDKKYNPGSAESRLCEAGFIPWSL